MRKPRAKKLLFIALLGGGVAYVRQRMMASPVKPQPVGSSTGVPRPATSTAPTARSSPSTAPGTASADADTAPVDAAPSAAESAPADAGGATGEHVDGLAFPTPPRGPFATAPDGPADDLKRISGVGPKLEKMLNEQGITTFAQLAELTDAQVDELQDRLPEFPGRIRRDRWVEQAARLQQDG